MANSKKGKAEKKKAEEINKEETLKKESTAAEQEEVMPDGEEAAPEPETEEPEETDPLKILENKLTKAEEDAQASHDRLLRATAEFDNYKKRSERELGEFRKFANERLIKELLPVMDNLERAIESSTDDSANSVIIEGVEMTLKEIYKVLEKFNLKSLDAEGKTFDPNFHQAVLQEETDEQADNTVLKVMQKGYILHDRLIRPAMVVVAKAKTKKDDSADSENEAAGKVN